MCPYSKALIADTVAISVHRLGVVFGVVFMTNHAQNPYNLQVHVKDYFDLFIFISSDMEMKTIYNNVTKSLLRL